MANLLEKASIILTPTAYDDGKVLAIKPSEAPYGDFDFTRNSSATRVNAQGLVEDVQILSSNLVQNGDFSQIGSEEVTNGNFSQESSELILNGDFATDSDWQLTQATISNGKATFVTTDGSFAGIRQNVFTIGKTYLISLEVSNLIGTAQVNTNGGTSIGLDITSNGIKSFYMVAENTDIEIKRKFGITNVSASIDNVSVKEVGQDWSLASGWSIGDGVAVAEAGVATKLVQSNTFNGKNVKVTLTISDYGGSGVAIVDFGSTSGSSIGANGTYTFYGQYDINNFELYKSATFNGSITNISVKEVGQDWTLYAGWSIGENKVVGDGTAFTDVAQAPILIQNKKIKLTFDVLDYVSGTFRIRPSDRQDGLDERFSGNGSYEVIYTSTTDYFRFQQQALVGSITNISIIEITDDTNLPRINYSGFTYQDSLGSEEIVNGGFDTDSNWVKQNSWSIENGSANCDGSGNFRSISQSALTNQIGKTYKISYEVSNYVSGEVRFILGGLNLGQIVSANGVHTETIQATNPSTNSYIYIETRGSGFVGSIDNVSVKEYLGQEVVPDSGCGAWLFEPESTNRITYSEDFSQWINTRSSDLIGFTSPNGTSNATKLISDTTVSSSHIIKSTSFSISSGQKYTYSVFLKANQLDYARIVFTDILVSKFLSVYFDLTSGTVGTTSSGSTATLDNANIEDFGNGWFKCSVFGDLDTVTNAQARIYLAVADNDSNFDGDGTSGIYIWGAQLEQQSYATSYIPTEGTIKTRNRDLCTNGGDVSLINSEEGVLYAQISGLESGNTYKLLEINNEGTTDRVYIAYRNSSLYGAVIVGGATQFVFSSTVTVTDFNKVALKYKENDFALWINGTEVATDSSGITSTSNTLNNIYFSNSSNGIPFFGNTKALGVWKEALTDAELRSLTYPTPTAATFDLDFNTIATDFTFTRNSEATFVNAQGLIQSTNELGAEEIINGNFETDSNWVKQAGWTISGGTANANMILGGNGNIYQTALVIGKTYELTFTVSNYVQGYVRNVSQAGSMPLYSSNGTFTERFVATASNLFMNASVPVSTQLSIDNVSVKEYITETNTPRLDYSTGAEAFLLEPQRTNLIPYSEDFTVWNQIQNVNLISNSTISPSGENNATKFLSTTGSSKVRNNFSSVSGTTYTFSVYCKNIDATFVRLLAYDGANEFSAYVVSQINTSTWTKVSLTFTAANTSNSAQVQIARDLPDGQSLYFWGAQLEGSSYATSYIPTSGTTVTRNQELCNNATPVINSEEGVLYAEIAALSNDVTNRAISISDGTTSNVVRFYYSTTDNRIVGNVKSEGITSFTFNNVLSNATNFLKIAISYKLNNFKMYVNGIEVASDTVGNAPIGLSELSFDNGVGNDKFFGNTKGLKIYPKALADVELQDLTTI